MDFVSGSPYTFSSGYVCASSAPGSHVFDFSQAHYTVHTKESHLLSLYCIHLVVLPPLYSGA